MSTPSTYEHYIGGRWTPPVRGEYFDSIDPTTGQAWYRAARGSAEDVDAAVKAAQRAFDDPRWRGLSQTARGRLVRRLGDLIAENAEDLAMTETRDNGKLLREMRAQLGSLPE